MFRLHYTTHRPNNTQINRLGGVHPEGRARERRAHRREPQVRRLRHERARHAGRAGRLAAVQLQLVRPRRGGVGTFFHPTTAAFCGLPYPPFLYCTRDRLTEPLKHESVRAYRCNDQEIKDPKSPWSHEGTYCNLLLTAQVGHKRESKIRRARPSPRIPASTTTPRPLNHNQTKSK